MLYRVKWEVDVDAKSPRDAAKQALRMQRDPESWATVFDVSRHDKYSRKCIDLGVPKEVRPK